MWSQKKVKMIKDIVCIVFLSKCVQFTSKYTLQTQDTIHCRIFNWYWTTFYHQYLDKKPDPIYFYLYKDLKINTFKKIKGNTVYYHHFVWLSDSQTRSSSIFEFYLRCLWTWNEGVASHRVSPLPFYAVSLLYLMIHNIMNTFQSLLSTWWS